MATPDPASWPRQPAFAVGRQKDDVLAAGVLQRAREAGDDPLGPARTVRLDQVRDPQRPRCGRHHELTLCRPTASATSV